jgi:hypothetical protein
MCCEHVQKEANMTVEGTVTISLSDYEAMQCRLKRHEDGAPVEAPTSRPLTEAHVTQDTIDRVADRMQATSTTWDRHISRQKVRLNVDLEAQLPSLTPASSWPLSV